MSPNSRSKVEGFKVQEFKSKLEKVKSELGITGLHREFEPLGGAYALRERSETYSCEFDSENDALRLENTIFWDKNAEAART